LGQPRAPAIRRLEALAVHPSNRCGLTPGYSRLGRLPKFGTHLPCPMRLSCLEFALAAHELSGVTSMSLHATTSRTRSSAAKASGCRKITCRPRDTGRSRFVVPEKSRMPLKMQSASGTGASLECGIGTAIFIMCGPSGHGCSAKSRISLKMHGAAGECRLQSGKSGSRFFMIYGWPSGHERFVCGRRTASMLSGLCWFWGELAEAPTWAFMILK
jgi:hypothetical protein